MGGYEEKESQIAAHYLYQESTVEYPVEALNLLKMYGNFAAVKMCIRDRLRMELLYLFPMVKAVTSQP